MLERIRRWFAADSELKMAEGERFLIVGLGNPGKKHQKNRHNIGFMAVDRLAGQNEIPLGKVQSKAVLGNGRIAGQQVILAKPQTYMNRSGDSVGPLVNYYRVPLENVLVIYDELDLPFGTLRLRQSGGSGGHNGMKSIINHLGQDFPRMRLGIGRPPGRMEPADFVLRDFRGQELEVAD
ncbi:MAG: aminoacyl-tRNA hydrolase, partial [Candidatus Promineifilaceae bacterium]